MPNWVYNSITISGETTKVKALRDKLGATHDYKGSEYSDPFSFWNIIAPTDLEAYNQTVGTGGRTMDDKLSWYGWNCANWGTKWNSSETTLEEEELGEGEYELNYHFDTAWSMPEPIMHWTLEYCQDNNLSLYWHFEEEQGWGGTMSHNKLDGETVFTEWDIPESHAEMDSLGKDCVCTYNEPEFWFEDCPRD
jgi:hypothetical protein